MMQHVCSLAISEFSFARADLIFCAGELATRMLATVDAHGEVFSYPPIHMHHYHLYQVDVDGLLAPYSHFLKTETHGDSGCPISGLGGLCYMQTFPPGAPRR